MSKFATQKMSRLVFLVLFLLTGWIPSHDCTQDKVNFRESSLNTSIQSQSSRNLLQTTAKIKAGIDAPEGRFPYMCNIRKIGSDEVVCGAVLVSEHWVLTAAHCVEFGNSEAAGINPIVHCGVNELEHEHDDLIFVTEEIRIHEDWDGETENGNDIALLKLERPCHLTTPIIPRSNITLHFGQKFSVLGWGRTTSDGPHASTLQLADDLPYIPKENCNSERLWDGSITDAMLCAGSRSTDSCPGDSGGPLILANRKAGNDILEGRPKLDLLVGIVSFGQEPCGETGLPGVCTSVSYYIEWINSVISEEEDEEDEETADTSSTGSDAEKNPTGSTEEGKHDTTTEEEEVTEEEDETTRLLEAAKKKYRKNTKAKNVKVAKRVIQRDDSISLAALLELGLDVDSIVISETKTTLLHWVAEFAAIECLKVLIEEGADIEKKDTYDATPLANACLSGSIAATKLLVEAGAKLKPKNKFKQTILVQAATTNSPSLINFLVRNKVKIEAVDDSEATAIFSAARYGSPSVVKAFLKYDPELDVHDLWGLTPLHYAASSRHILRDIFLTGPPFFSFRDVESVDPFIPSNLESGNVYKLSSRFALVPERVQERWEENKPKNRDVDVIKLLLDASAPVSAQDKQGKTPLHVSVMSNSTKIIETLIEYGANVNATDDIWNTPLHEAVVWSTPDVVQALVDADANIEAKDIYGNTPLHIAVAYGNYFSSKTLVDNGADPFANNQRGSSIENAACTIVSCSNSDKAQIRALLV